MKKISAKQRDMLLLPGICIAGLTIAFICLDGGSGPGNTPAPVTATQHLNTRLPPALLKTDKGLDKIAFYKKAEQDSIRAVEQAKREELIAAGGAPSMGLATTSQVSIAGIDRDSNVQQVNSRLAALRQTLRQSETMSGYRIGENQRNQYPFAPSLRQVERSLPSPDIDRLERLMHVMKESGSTGNPEMRQLDTVLDKLIDVQGRRPRSKPAEPDATTDPSLPVHLPGAVDAITTLKAAPAPRNRFYDLESNTAADQPTPAAIEALVTQTQTLINGSVLQLELATELVIKDQHVPKGTPLFGMVKLNGERLMVSIKSIRFGSQVFPVSLQVLDQDGLAGIYEPGSINRDVARESGAQSVVAIGPTLDGTSIGTQAAGAGIQMAKNLTTKKMRLTRVTVKAGYRVFLQDQHQLVNEK